MSESLIPRQPNLPETREASLTRQFYEWEARGRGWNVRPFPVELEPPFRPMYIFDPGEGEIVDDGRKPTFLSRLFAPSKKNIQTQTVQNHDDYRERLAELDEPVVCDYYEEDFSEFQIVLSRDQKVTKSLAEQLLSSLSYCSHPISFEVVGTKNEISVQMAATDRDRKHLEQQLRAHLHGALIRETSGYLLEESWEEADGYPVIVDFGLSQEFLIPLRAIPNLDLDPLVSIVGAMSDLKGDEIGIFQVLFQKARNDWATEILDSVRFYDGTPFFANAPEMVPFAKQKVGSSLFASIVRVAVKSPARERALQLVRSIASGLSQLSSPTGNELIPLSNDGYRREYHEQALLQRLSFRCGMILNMDELVSLVHPPSTVVRSGKLVRDDDKTKAAPPMTLGHSLVIGKNEHQREANVVTLSNEQRTRHMHLIGSSGSGKSTLLLSLIQQDLETGQGLCVIDPHGDLIDAVIENVPDNRLNDVVLFDPSDSGHPIGFNILQANSELEKTILSSDLIATFRRMSTSWGDVMDSVLANAILAFIESSRGGTLFELKRFLVEKDFREAFLESVTDDAVRYFWEHEFQLISGKPQSSILIRLDGFLRQALIRNIVCQKDNRLDFRRIMDSRRILLIKLSQGQIGEENAYLLGTMIVSRLYQAALGRQDSQDRPHFWLYLDEFHHFITPSMERILSGTRKYNLGLILAHQEFRQMQSRSLEVASGVLSNCYTRICFRLGDADAEKFAGGFSFFDSKALQNLGVGEAIARVERADYDFNLTVEKVPDVSRESAALRRTKIIELARTRFGKPRVAVEAEQKANRPAPKVAETKPALEKPEKVTHPLPTTLSKDVSADHVPSEHRYLQNIIKRIGENRGFVATLEKPVLGGVGKIDVALENEQIRIACEIAVTNTTEYEVYNIQKCLSSGFDRMSVVSSDARHLERIRKRAELMLTQPQLSKVHFLDPEHFHLFLDSLVAIRSSNNLEPEKVKGYIVKTSVKKLAETDANSKRGVVRIFSRDY
jgi:hypothetical protein